MKRIVIILFVFGVLSLSPIPAQAGAIERWSEPPRDAYVHAGASALCTSLSALVLIKLNSEGKVPASIKALVFCTLLGLSKEYVSDSKPSAREMLLNLSGGVVGLFVVHFY